MAPRAERVLGALAGLQRRADDARVGADRKRVVVARESARERDEAARPVALGKRPRAPGRAAAALLRQDPDLEDPGGLGFAVELRVGS